jgi:hypothetical protein
MPSSSAQFFWPALLASSSGEIFQAAAWQSLRDQGARERSSVSAKSGMKNPAGNLPVIADILTADSVALISGSRRPMLKHLDARAASWFTASPTNQNAPGALIYLFDNDTAPLDAKGCCRCNRPRSPRSPQHARLTC